MDENPPAVDLDSAVAADETPTEPSSSAPDSAGSAGVKPKRGRGRARRAAKTAVEPVLESAPATWIRVGPGKFVRADATIQAVDPTQVEEVAVEAVPETDPPHTPDPPVDAAPAVTLAEPGPLEPPATTPDDVGMLVRSDDSVVASVTEEYGITPSAFGPDSRDSSVTDGLDHHVSEEVADEPEAVPVPIATPPDVDSSRDGDDQGQLRSPRRTPSVRTGRVSRGIASTFLGADRLSTRHVVRGLVSIRTERAPPASNAPRLRTNQSRPACVATTITTSSLIVRLCRKSSQADTIFCQ
jgi:hypothetical protein